MSETIAPGMKAPQQSWWSRRPLAVLIGLLVLAWVPALLNLPPLDRDESRFAEASRQMVDTGNYIDIRFASGPRYNKPIGIYWLQSLSATVAGPAFRGSIWVYRLPSALGDLLATIFLYLLARRIASRETALVAAVLLGTTFLLAAESVIATTDAALLATIVAAQSVLMRIYLAARQTAQAPGILFVMAGWVAIGLGVLLKGPVILAVLAVTSVALSLWDRDFAWLRTTRPLPGAALALALILPWAVAIGFASHGAFYQQSLGNDFAAKLLEGRESHGAPPGYYLLETVVAFWPATLVLIPALAFAIAQRRQPAVRFLLAWSAGVWVLFECVPTKLPHYILPAYPALAILCALWITQKKGARESEASGVSRVATTGLFMIGAMAAAAACIWLPMRFGGRLGPLLLTSVLAAFALACMAAVFLFQSGARRATAFAVASAVAFDLLLGLGVGPQLPDLWLSPRAAQLVAANRHTGDPPPVVTGYVEPSLIFLLGSGTRIAPARLAAAATPRGGLALVDARAKPEFLAGVASSSSKAQPLGNVSGLDYSVGRREQVTLYRVTPAQR